MALQALRHDCDYKPAFRLARVTAQNALADARAAVRNLGDADPVELREFLAYLLFGLR